MPFYLDNFEFDRFDSLIADNAAAASTQEFNTHLF
jgi:hypothetical protein